MSLLRGLAQKLERVAHPLRYLFIEITQRCNLRCRHCGSDCGREPRPNELTTAEWLRLFDSLGQRVKPRSLVLCLTGGEPLCHPQLDEILTGLCRNQLPFGLVTNGFAVTDRVLHQLINAGLVSVTISLDGLAESHDWLRGVEGSFARAQTAIARVAALGLPNFDVVTCVSPRNLRELPAVEALLRASGVPAWRLFSIFPRGRAKGNAELLLSNEGFRQLLAYIRDARAQRPRGMSVQFCCEGYLPPALDALVRDERFFCRAGIAIASVLSDGAISACPNITRALVQGNVREDDLLAVWEQRFTPFRERSWMRQGRCRDCGQWRRCQGNSLHLWDDALEGIARCTWAAAADHDDA